MYLPTNHLHQPMHLILKIITSSLTMFFVYYGVNCSSVTTLPIGMLQRLFLSLSPLTLYIDLHPLNGKMVLMQTCVKEQGWVVYTQTSCAIS